MGKRFTIGTDPEFFMRRKTDSKLISAIPFINGTKEEPLPLESGGNVQRDNVAIEFATDPATDGKDLVEKISNAFKDILRIIPTDHDLVVEPAANFDNDQLEHEEALQFGCDPDYCAWDLVVNEPPFCIDKNLRTCGGHIHVGHVKGDGNEFLLDPYGKADTVKLMDVFHGIASVLLDSSEEAVRRRQLYGKAGCHRPTEYGLEYRVLSNFWFKSPDLVMLMDSLTQDVLRIMREMDFNKLIKDIGENRIRSTINEGNTAEAKKIFDKFVIPLLSKDSMHYYQVSTEKLSEKPDFTKEWKLEV